MVTAPSERQSGQVGDGGSARGKHRSTGAETGDRTTEAEGRRRRSLAPLLALRPYLTRHSLMLVVLAVAIVVSAGAMLTVPMAIRRMIDFGFSSADGGLINRSFSMLLVLGAVLAVASAGRFYCVNWLGERVAADLRQDVFAHLTTLGPDFFERTRSGELMSRLTADATLLKSAAGSAISQALRNLMMLIGALTMMVVTSPRLSALVLIAIPVIVLPLMAYGRSVRRLSRVAQDTLAEASGYAAENLAAVSTMQAFSHEASVRRRFGAAVERSFDAALARMRARSGLTAVVIFLVFASVVGVLWYGASEVIAGRMTGGRLGQFVLYALFAGGAVAELSEVWGEIQQAAGASERMAELMALTPSISTPAHPRPLPSPVRGEIAFRDVTFAYPSRPDEPAVRAFNLTVRAGETVAIVGPSGAGKSTLFSLALRFFDPQQGAVLIDDVPIREVSLIELRRCFALVPQELALFADTIAENIRYGTAGASDADVVAAAKAAQADSFIQALPRGYETMLGERGITLSGGQRQRIAIARAILRKAPVLLLDEATSALDAESERLVQQALEPLMAGRTTLVIAHRLATVQRADRIVVMEGGAIVEEGTHAELARAGGTYSRLAALQFRDAAE